MILPSFAVQIIQKFSTKLDSIDFLTYRLNGDTLFNYKFRVDGYYDIQSYNNNKHDYIEQSMECEDAI
jgi:hypothetical protein